MQYALNNQRKQTIKIIEREKRHQAQKALNSKAEHFRDKLEHFAHTTPKTKNRVTFINKEIKERDIGN